MADGLAGDASALTELAADPALSEACVPHGILPLLYERALAAGVSSPLVDRWRRALLGAAGHWLVLERSLGSVAETLGRAGVGWAPIKGMDTATRVFERPEERPTSDLDILIRRADLERAREALAAGGWGARVGRDGAGEDYLREEAYVWHATDRAGVFAGGAPAAVGLRRRGVERGAVELGSGRLSPRGLRLPARHGARVPSQRSARVGPRRPTADDLLVGAAVDSGEGRGAVGRPSGRDRPEVGPPPAGRSGRCCTPASCGRESAGSDRRLPRPFRGSRRRCYRSSARPSGSRSGARLGAAWTRSPCRGCTSRGCSPGGRAGWAGRRRGAGCGPTRARWRR